MEAKRDYKNQEISVLQHVCIKKCTSFSSERGIYIYIYIYIPFFQTLSLIYGAFSALSITPLSSLIQVLMGFQWSCGQFVTVRGIECSFMASFTASRLGQCVRGCLKGSFVQQYLLGLSNTPPPPNIVVIHTCNDNRKKMEGFFFFFFFFQT